MGLAAAKACRDRLDCDFFIYDSDTQTAQFCSGRDFFVTSPASGSSIGVKPSALSIPGTATIANYAGMCPQANLLTEHAGVKDVDEASTLCKANPNCTHWWLDVSGSRSMPKTRQLLKLCSGD